MHRSQARDLLKKHREGTLTHDERVILESWYKAVKEGLFVRRDFKDGQMARA